MNPKTTTNAISDMIHGIASELEMLQHPTWQELLSKEELAAINGAYALLEPVLVAQEWADNNSFGDFE